MTGDEQALAEIRAARERREVLGLTEAEAAAAERFGMSQDHYAAMKQVRNVNDWLARHAPKEER